MTWNLVRELGIEYAPSPEPKEHQRLCFPTYAAQALDGTYIISEEIGVNKLVPFRFECRTLRVDQDAHVRFDSKTLGIDDGFGNLMGDDCIAIVRRTHWELLIVSPDGDVMHQLDLHRFSKRIPRYARWTTAGTFLVIFFNRSFDVDIVEIDGEGRLLWYLPPGNIGIPGSVQRLDNDNLLIADSFRHCIREIDREGNTLWQFGEPENPSNRLQSLCNPNSATCLPDGECVVADTRNHRILSVNRDGVARRIPLPRSGLCDPNYVTTTSAGDYLICDTGNGRVVQVDPQGDVVWEYGDSFVGRRHLSYPRSIDFVAPDRYLVADTGNDRIVEFLSGDVQTKRFGGQNGLFWPRCVRRLAAGSYLIADARNGRIVEVAENGEVLNELGDFKLDSGYTLRDPHDVHLLPNDHLLICDSPHNLVIEVDWSGNVYRVIGHDNAVTLKDPHSAQQLSDGSLLVADTGNHRLLIISADGQLARSIQAINQSPNQLRLHYPRYAEASADGTVVIADTAQNRILGCTLSGEYLWEFTQVPGSRVVHLNQPRWATMVTRDELVVCDHFHHRIVHVKRSPQPRDSS